LCRTTHFDRPTRSFEYELAFNASLRKNSYKAPCNWLVPILVVTLSTPPAVRPYWAWKLLVCTLNCCTDSSGGEYDVSLVVEFSICAPSSSTALAFDRPPLISGPVPGFPFGFTPGASTTSEN